MCCLISLCEHLDESRHRGQRSSHLICYFSMAQVDMGKSPQPTSRLLLLAGGNLTAAMKKLEIRVSQDDFQAIGRTLYSVLHPVDVLFLGFLALCSVPTIRMMFSIPAEKYDGIRYQFASHVSQAARLALLVYCFDCIIVVLCSLGFSFPSLGTLSKGFAKILFISWIGFRLSVFKRYMLETAIFKNSKKLGRVSLVDRLLDGAIIVITGFFLIECLDVDMGVGVTSIFAFGSAGTLVIGLATQKFAAMFVNGIVLTASDRISEGDHIKTGNGLSGRVQKIGWFQTTLRHYNELEEIIPNSELGMQRVTNVSRCRKCQIKQVLRIKYEDIDKIETFIQDIKTEIIEACPMVITDRSRPFRAYLTAFKEDHVQVSVDTHFNVRPLGEVFFKNQHNCLMAIARAAKKNDIEFVSGLYPQGINKHSAITP